MTVMAGGKLSKSLDKMPSLVSVGDPLHSVESQLDELSE